MVEDLEHAGASTLEALRFMAGRLQAERLLIVVTVRPEEGREAMETLEHAGREIVLRPFSEAELDKLALYVAGEKVVTAQHVRDLEVDDDIVWMRTTDGPVRVDIIYRRVDDEYLDRLFDRETRAPAIFVTLKAPTISSRTILMIWSPICMIT